MLRDGRVEVMADAGGAAPSTPAADNGAIGRCVRERRPVLMADASVDGGTRSELAVPLYVGGQVWGAIDVRSAGDAGFDSRRRAGRADGRRPRGRGAARGGSRLEQR
jgi:hypothetical protein